MHVSTAQDFAAALSGLPKRAKHFSQLDQKSTSQQAALPSDHCKRVGAECCVAQTPVCMLDLDGAGLQDATSCGSKVLRRMHAGKFAVLFAGQYHITFYPIILSSCRLCTVAWSPSLSARSTVEHPLINRSRKSPGRQDALVRQTADVASHRIGPSTSTTDGGGWVRWTPVQTPEPGHGRSWQGPGDPLYHYERGAVAQTSSIAVATQQCFVSHTSHRAGETGLTAEFDLAPVCSANPGQSWQIEQPLPVL